MRSFNIPLTAFWPITALLSLILLFIYSKYRQRKKEPLELPPSSTPEAAPTTAVAPATSVAPTPPAPPGALITLQVLPNRDKLLSIAKDRAKTGLCLYCDELASTHRPAFVHRRPPGEEIYTFLGGTTRDVWKVQRERMSGFFADAQEYQQLKTLCRTCAEIEGALYQDFLSARNAEYSAFALEQRTSFHEYATYTAFEEMYRKLRSMRMKKDNNTPPTTGT